MLCTEGMDGLLYHIHGKESKQTAAQKSKQIAAPMVKEHANCSEKKK